MTIPAGENAATPARACLFPEFGQTPLALRVALWTAERGEWRCGEILKVEIGG